MEIVEFEFSCPNELLSKETQITVHLWNFSSSVEMKQPDNYL